MCQYIDALCKNPSWRVGFDEGKVRNYIQRFQPQRRVINLKNITIEVVALTESHKNVFIIVKFI